MAKVILTGASGFVGREVATQLLERGHEVHVLGRRPAETAGAFHQPADLLSGAPDISSIGASHLVHCAWYAEPGRFWDAPENCDWVAASLLLARAFAAAGGRRMVVAGSCAEYAWDPPVLIEDQLGGAPATLYGQAKRSLFETLSAAAPVFGLSLGWGRIFMPFGAREDPRRLLGTLIAARAGGHEATFSAGDQVRDFIHVTDVARALVAVLECGFEGAVNIGSGIGTSVRDFVLRASAIGEYSDKVRLGARILRSGEPASVVADVRRLAGEIGFRPAYSLEQGLKEALSHG